MTEQIGVTYSPVLYEGRHLALYYERSDGTRTVIEAWGANKDTMTTGQKAAGAMQDAWMLRSENFGSPWGPLVGPSTSGERDWDTATDGKLNSETILTSDNLAPGQTLSGIWADIESDATARLAAHYEYRPFSQNSNTFVATLLADTGVPFPTGWSNGMTLAPGLQYRLHDPLGSRSDLPTSLDATDFAFSDPSGSTMSLVVGDPTDVTLQWGNGTLGVDIASDVEPAQPDTGTSITGVNGHVALVGTSGNDTFDGHGSDCLMLGGSGDDALLLGYGGNDWIDGGSGNDTATYSKSADSYTVMLSAENGLDTGPANDQIVQVTDNASGGIDRLTSVEDMRLRRPQWLWRHQ